jgi:hypothetical protein
MHGGIVVVAVRLAMLGLGSVSLGKQRFRSGVMV